MTTSTYCQNNICYSHDARGRRFCKQICIDLKNPDSLMVQYDTIQNQTIKVWPNPTKQYVNIDLLGDINYKSVTMEIFSVGGLKLSQIDEVKSHNVLDFGKYNYGMYFITISINSDRRTYKIIKQY